MTSEGYGYSFVALLQLGEDVLVDVVDVGRVLLLLQFQVESVTKLAEVGHLEELEFVGDLMHLTLLLERKRLLHPGER